MHLFRKEHAQNLLAEDQHFERSLTARDLIALGIGAVIGTGIFILPGTAAATEAGPGIALSFLLAAVVCILSAMCYAEFASAIPVAGSAYSYGNIVYGEIVGWILGWALVLEYMLAVAAGAAGFSSYFQSFIKPFGLHLPASISGPMDLGHGVYFDIVAISAVLIVCFLLSRGMRTSVKINNVAVLVKVAIVILFIVVGCFFIKPANYHPFLPYKVSGVIKGATTVFFAYLGFDAVSASAAEVKNPQENMPKGIIGTLSIVSILYMLVALVLTGMVKYTKLDVANPVAFALQLVHQDWLAELLSIGILLGMVTMMITMIYSSSRLVYAMARDGLLPHFFAKLDDKHNSPQRALWTVGTIIAVSGGIFSVNQLANLVNFGTLLAFTFVSFGVLLLRRRSDLKNDGYKVPGYPVVPILSGAASIFMLCHLSKEMWTVAGIWFIIGLLIYFAYGYWHSQLQEK